MYKNFKQQAVNLMKLYKANQKGVSIVWAILSFVIILLVVTGVLMTAQVFHKRERNDISQKQADYLARSAIDIFTNQITGNQIKISEIGDGNIYAVEINDNEKKYDPIEVKIDKKTNFYISYTATAKYGGMTGKLSGSVYKSAGDWAFQGYSLEN